MFKLILKFQDAVVDEFTFHNIPVTIGRRDDNDVVVDNMAVSGHHAVIEMEEPNYYVLVDLDSLNGTFLNEVKTSRDRIFDGDTIIIGKHSLVFQDLRPENERPQRNRKEREKPSVPDFRDIAVLETERQQELVARQPREQDVAAEPLPERPVRRELHGSLTIISGGIPQIIELTKRLTTLGKSDEADVKCSGLLVGKTAALINKRPNGYFLSYAEGMKKPEVNGDPVATQVQLHDGDEIVVGSTKMTFNLTEVVQSP
ncbi:MAG: FHA domain-containing protein [Desulfomonile sp.]|nr:FHA domain-containing protein [Desulfomonile sp.]